MGRTRKTANCLGWRRLDRTSVNGNVSSHFGAMSARQERASMCSVALSWTQCSRLKHSVNVARLVWNWVCVESWSTAQRSQDDSMALLRTAPSECFCVQVRRRSYMACRRALFQLDDWPIGRRQDAAVGLRLHAPLAPISQVRAPSCLHVGCPRQMRPSGHSSPHLSRDALLATSAFKLRCACDFHVRRGVRGEGRQKHL